MLFRSFAVEQSRRVAGDGGRHAWVWTWDAAQTFRGRGAGLRVAALTTRAVAVTETDFARRDREQWVRRRKDRLFEGIAVEAVQDEEVGAEVADVEREGRVYVEHADRSLEAHVTDEDQVDLGGGVGRDDERLLCGTNDLTVVVTCAKLDGARTWGQIHEALPDFSSVAGARGAELGGDGTLGVSLPIGHLEVTVDADFVGEARVVVEEGVAVAETVDGVLNRLNVEIGRASGREIV